MNMMYQKNGKVIYLTKMIPEISETIFTLIRRVSGTNPKLA